MTSLEKNSRGLSPRLSFREAAIRSKRVTERQFENAVEVAGSEDSRAVAAALVRSGIITEYQSQQLMAGRSKLTLGQYLVTDFIGQGGMGQVFKAVHEVMGRECAVKVLPLEKLTAETKDRFIREVRTQSGLDSQYIVRAFDAGSDGRVHYLVTEYVPGTDLRRLVRSNGPLSMEESASVVSQAAIGLQHIHDAGIIHRDVKPGNILVTPEGHAKVTDIGLYAWNNGSDDDMDAGKIVGTADFLAPEQVRDPRSIGPLSDIYSLGCTLYYAVTGKVPFPGGDSKSKCRRHCEQTPWHPRKFALDIGEDFVDLMADMMEKDPTRRIASAADVAERLEPWVTSEMEVIDRPIDRQVWTPPPPPQEPSQLRLTLDDAEADPTGEGTSGSQLESTANVSAPGLPLGLESDSELSDRAQSRGAALPVAIALAVAVPLSLLVGAIIGFMVASQM